MRERPDDKRVTKKIRNIHATFAQMMCEIDHRQKTAITGSKREDLK